MAETNNDRQAGDQQQAGEGARDKGALPKPEIKIIVDGESVYKPGMKVFFASEEESGAGEIENADNLTTPGKVQSTVLGEFCTCNTVLVTTQNYAQVEGTKCSCDSHCTCQSVNTCPNFSSYTPYKGGSQSTCPANPATQTVPCSTNYGGTTGCPSVSCNGPCACVPVH